MKRRAFLGRLAVGLAGLAASGSVSAERLLAWSPGPARRFVAMEWLRTQYNDWIEERLKRTGQLEAPERLEVGSALFNAIESEMQTCQRITEGHGMLWTAPKYPGSLMFKGSPMLSKGAGWGVQFFAEA